MTQTACLLKNMIRKTVNMSIPIKTINDLDPLERLALVEFSYSRIDTYTQCPSKYFYSYIQKEPRLFGEAATLRKHSPCCIGKGCR